MQKWTAFAIAALVMASGCDEGLYPGGASFPPHVQGVSHDSHLQGPLPGDDSDCHKAKGAWRWQAELVGGPDSPRAGGHASFTLDRHGRAVAYEFTITGFAPGPEVHLHARTPKGDVPLFARDVAWEPEGPPADLHFVAKGAWKPDALQLHPAGGGTPWTAAGAIVEIHCAGDPQRVLSGPLDALGDGRKPGKKKGWAKHGWVGHWPDGDD